jgi:hypothetical protein
MDGVRLRIERERAHQIVDRHAMLPQRFSGTTALKPGGDGARIEGDSVGQHPLRVVGSAQRQIGLAQPDERRHIVWFQFERLFECRCRLWRILPASVRVTQVVGPTRVG